jgi:hypothetical protein
MVVVEKSKGLPCDSCKQLIGANRRTAPHSNLVQTNYKSVDSVYGSVDEYYYKCKVCGKEWLHEMGSYGQGWIE